MHTFVRVATSFLASRKESLSDAVRNGVVKKDVARAEYDRIVALVEFIEASAERYDAERAYAEIGTPDGSHPVLAALAQTDGRMRLLWERWENKDDNHE